MMEGTFGLMVLLVWNCHIRISCGSTLESGKVSAIDGGWSSWSKCSKTCKDVGALQIRTCNNPIPQHKGKNCAGPASQKCNQNSPCRNIKIRKNVATLTDPEKQRLVTRLKEIIASKTPWKNYKDNANIHGAPLNIIIPCKSGFCCPHSDPAFLPWHRLYMVNMEQLLNESLPYWDWTESSDIPKLWDGIPGPIKPPHKSISSDCVGNDDTHHRRATDIKNRIDAENLKGRTRTALVFQTFDKFRKQIESAHNSLHVAMRCDMRAPESAAYDPIFYLHHAYVDYQFAYWQELQKLRGKPVDWSSSNKIMAPFDDHNYNPYVITRANSKEGDVLDYENKLHFKYDKLLFNGLTPQEFRKKHHMNGRKKRSEHPKCLFVGVVMPKMAPTSLVKFEICNSQETCIEGGNLATFGPISSKPVTYEGNNVFKNYDMIEYEVTDAINEDASFDTRATARITSTDDHVTMSELQPIMIWRHYLGEQGGVVYLPPGAKKKDYGKFLNEYDEVKENKPMGEAGDYNCQDLIIIKDEWNGYMRAILSIKLVEAITSYSISLQLDNPVNKIEFYEANATPSTGTSFTVTPKSWFQGKATGENLDLEFLLGYDGTNAPKFTSIFLNDQNVCDREISPSGGIAPEFIIEPGASAACPYTDTFPAFCADWKDAHCTGPNKAWMAENCRKTCNC